MEPVSLDRPISILRSPLLVLRTFFGVLCESCASILAHLLHPKLFGTLSLLSLFLYAFLYYPPALLAGLRDVICTVRLRLGPCLPLSPSFPSSLLLLMHSPKQRRLPLPSLRAQRRAPW
jgi:hypothetical protein